MQDYSPIAGFSLTLVGQRVSIHKCGSDPPNAGHLAPMKLPLGQIIWANENIRYLPGSTFLG